MQQMIPIFTMVAWTIVAANEAVQAIATETARSTTTSLRGRHHYPPNRNLILRNPSKSNNDGGHQSTYKGCLGYSDSELSQSWSFSSEAPSCSWVHGNSYNNNNNNNDGNGDGSSSGGSSSGESNGDDDGSYGNGGSGDGANDGDNINSNNGDSWDDDSANGGENGDDNGDDNVDDGNGSGGGNDDASGYQDATDDEVVVSNEDMYDGDAEYDPIDDFDIEVCDSYENLWLWDLAFSCNTTDGCSCTFAEELVENERLACEDAPLCPENCTVCSTCLDLMECDDSESDTKIPGGWRSLSAPTVFYIVGAAVAMLLFGLAAHYSRKKWSYDGGLEQNLIDKDAVDPDTKQNTMYMHGSDLAWRPLPSDQEYASQQLRQSGTMSTASTGKHAEDKTAARTRRSSNNSGSGSGRENERYHENESASRLHGEDLFTKGGTATIPSMVDTSHAQDSMDTMAVSPIQTREESSSDDDADFVFEDASPRTVSTEGGGEEKKKGI